MTLSTAPATAAGRSSSRGPKRFLEQNRFLLAFAVLASFMGLSVGMAQVSASLYAVELGSNNLMLGLIAGAQSVGVLLVSLPAGVLVDRFGPARPFLTGTLLAGLTYAAVPIVSSPAWLLLCTALISFFMPLRFVSLNTLFFQQLSALGESKAGWYRGTHMLGMSLLGPAVGARLISWLGFSWTYRLIALAFLITIFLSPIVFGRYARPPAPRRALGLRALRDPLRLLISDRQVRSVSFLELATQATSAFFTFFVVVLAIQSAGLNPEQASSLIAAKGAAYILALFALGGLVQRLRAWASPVSLAAVAGGLGALGLGGSWLLWLGSLLLGLGLGTVQIATLTRYAEIGGRAGHGKISGLSALVGPSGGVLGSLLGGLLARWIGVQSVFLSTSLVFAFAVLLLSLCARRPRSSVERAC